MAVKTKDYVVDIDELTTEGLQINAKGKNSIRLDGLDSGSVDSLDMQINGDYLEITYEGKKLQISNYTGLKYIKTDYKKVGKKESYDLFDFIANETVINNNPITQYNAKKLTVTGTAYNDTIDFTDSSYVPVGSKNIKANKGLTFNGGNGADNITGTKYNDVINGGNGDDVLQGGAGNDTITGGTGTNIIIHHKGDGNDVINLTKGENLILKVDELADGYVYGTSSIKYSANKKDVLVYISEDEYITIKNIGAKDVTNNATKKAEDTSSVLIQVGDEPDNIIDIRNLAEGVWPVYVTTKADKNFTGGWLNDEIDASDAYLTKTVKVNGGKVTVEKDVTEKGLKLDGGKGNDYIIGSKYSDTLIGGDGEDMLYGGDGNDVINGGKGNDMIEGGAGNDTITGGAGENYIIYSAGDGDDVINLTKGENLEIEMGKNVQKEGYTSFEYLDKSDVTYEYSANKKDLVIYADKNDKVAGSITLKNFATKDITNNATKKTEDTSSVTLYLKDGEDNIGVDLRKDISILTETDKNFTGTWLNDEINAKNAVLYKTVKVDGKKVQVEKADTDKGLTLNGGAGNDTIIGTRYSDTLKGGDGDDVIKSVKGDGNDVMYGGNGNDTISGGNGNDKLYGDNGNDSISGGNGNDTIYGGNGNDSIDGGNGDDKLYGDAGNDTIQGGGGNDTIYGGKGDDSIEGGNDDDLLYGDEGNDTINGGNGNDTIYGGKGNDSINGGTGDDVLYGGDGDDTLIGGSGIDTFYGGAGNDYIKSVVAGEYADGGDGNDYIEISGGTAVGGKGNDTIFATSGEGIVKFDAKSGHDTYINYRGNANDTLVFEKIASKQLSYSKSGDDLVIKYNKNTSVTVQDYFKDGNKPEEWGTYVQTKDGKQLLFDVVNANILPDVPEDVTKGTVGNDTLSSDINLDLIYGFYGNDTINSTGLYSTIYGGEGNDVINVEGGFSVVYGDEGNDAITSKSTAGYSTIYGGKGNDTITTSGDYGNNTLVFENGDGNDVIIQSSSEDRKADTIKLNGVDKDGFTQAISGNDLVISYNADSEGNYQDSITIKDFLKNPDDIPNYKIVTKDGYESTANMEYLKEEVASWLATYTFDDVASGLESATETQMYELNNAFMTANNEQIIPA